MLFGLIRYKNHYDKISLIILFLVVLIVFSSREFKIVDDAYISFRYAYNLAYNGELVFNTGDRVEGFSNLLWVLILAFQFIIFNFSVEEFSLFISLGLITFSTFRLWQISSLLGIPRPVGVIAALLLILNPEFVSAGTNGMEVSLYSALIIEIVYRYSRSQYRLTYFFSSLLFLTRPEGIFLGLLLLAIMYIEHRSVREVGVGVVILGSVTLLITLSRLFYYGYPIPNSIVAKSFNTGLLFEPDILKAIALYFLGFIESNPYLIIILSVSIIWFFKNRTYYNKSSLILLFCLAGILFSFLITIRNGGDWMEDHRLLTQYASLYSLLLISLRWKRSSQILFACTLLILPLFQSFRNVINYNFSSLYTYETEIEREDLLKRLSSVVSESDTISAEAVGYLSFNLLNNSFHDPVGLIDTYIARHGEPSITYGKHNSEYTVGFIKPAIMVWHTTFHIKGIEQKLLDNYETYCAADCDNWGADVVMIRHDRLSDLASAFSDWQKIEIKSDRIMIK